MEQCVHALKMRALRPLRETTYLRVEVHVTAYVAPAVADARAPQRYCEFSWGRSDCDLTVQYRYSVVKSFERPSVRKAPDRKLRAYAVLYINC